MFSGHVGPGQQVVDAAVGVIADEAGEHVGEVGVMLDGDQLAGLDEQGENGPVPEAVTGARGRVFLTATVLESNSMPPSSRKLARPS